MTYAVRHKLLFETNGNKNCVQVNTKFTKFDKPNFDLLKKVAF